MTRRAGWFTSSARRVIRCEGNLLPDGWRHIGIFSLKKWIFEWAPSVRILILIYFRIKQVMTENLSYKPSTSIAYGWHFCWREVSQKSDEKLIKSKILKKSIFSDFLAIFLANCSKNRVNVNKKFLAVTRRAGYLILGSKSNTVSGKSASGRLATYR